MIINRINTDIMDAMRHQDVVRRDALIAVRNDAAAMAKERKQKQITDELILSTVKRELNTLTATKARLSGHEDTDLYKRTVYRIGILGQYLPKNLSDEELKDKIKEIIEALPDSSDFGTKVMAAQSKMQEDSDNAFINNLLAFQ